MTTHFDTRESEIKDMFKHPFASDDSDVFRYHETTMSFIAATMATAQTSKKWSTPGQGLPQC
ncbi:hypothetical protein OK016_16285 [Vibrio chagasii]|nr:hypothetical protein [Vibrio chagasii]